MTDFSNYVDLTVFDLQPGDIYQNAIELARLTLPDFNLRPGTPEDAMFQAMSYVSALNVASINRMPSRLMAGIVGILGLERQQSVPAQVNILVTLSTYLGGIVPEGTVFVHESFFEDELQEFAFTTTSSVELAATNLAVSNAYPSAVITATSLDGGVIPPIQAGTVFVVLSSGTSILSAVAATPANFANGIDADTDSLYLARATTYLQSLTSAIARSTQLESFLLSQYPDIIARAKVYDLTYGDPVFGDTSVKRTAKIINQFTNNGNQVTLQTFAPHLFTVGETIRLAGVGAPIDGLRTITARGDDLIVFTIGGAASSASAQSANSASAFIGEDNPGYVSIYAYGYNSLVSSANKTTILNQAKSLSVAGLNISIHDPSFVTLTISTSVIVNEDYDATQVVNSINLAIIDFLSPSRFQFTDRIRQNQIVSLMSNIPGVVYVESLTMTPTGTGWLPKYGNDVLFKKKGTLPVISLGDITITYTIQELE